MCVYIQLLGVQSFMKYTVKVCLTHNTKQIQGYTVNLEDQSRDFNHAEF